DVGTAPYEAVEDASGGALEDAFTATAAAHAVDDLVALPPFRQHLWDELGRILKVRIHDHDGIACGVLDSGGHGDLVAEVARQIEQRRPGVGPPLLLHQ